MLVKFLKIVDQADECVAHNGDGYDIKWIRTRCAYHGLFCPDKINSYDTLKKARKQFRLNSNKLDYIAKFFGVGEKMDTGGFDLWVDVMKKNPIAMKTMVEYCKKDVIILEKVFKKIYEYSEVNTHTGVAFGDYRWTCPKCGSQKIRGNGVYTTKSGTTRQRMRCKTCNGGWRVSNAVYRNFLEWQYDQKKNKNN